MQYRIAMAVKDHVWRVTRCWQGKGKVPLVHTNLDGSKELVMSATYPRSVGDEAHPRGMLWLWQNRPRRAKAVLAANRARTASAVISTILGDSYA